MTDTPRPDDDPTGPGDQPDLPGFEIPDDLSGLDGVSRDEVPGDAATGPGAGGSGAPHAAGTPRDTPPGSASDADDADDLGLEIPDDLSGLTEPSADPDLAVLVTQIAGAEPLAAAASLAGLELDAVATEVGALAVLRDTSGRKPDEAAAALSKIVSGVPLVQVTRKGEQLTCVRWTDGERGDELSPALLLGGAPERVEDVITGFVKVADLDDVVYSGSIGRLKAMRMLTSAARKARRASRGKPGRTDD